MSDAKLGPGQFKVLTFDCYGTLVDWEAGIVAALRASRASRLFQRGSTQDGIEITDAALLEAFGRSEHKQEQAETGFRLYPKILEAVFNDIAAEFGEHDTAAHNAAHAEDAARFAGSVGEWPAFPDTVAALQRLKKNHRLVIVSNVDRASFARTQIQLGVELNAVITAEDVRSYKPAPGHFTRALELAAEWGVAQSEVLHVAQSLYHDHAPALALGLKTVWIDRRRGRSGTGATPTADTNPKPSWVFPDMATLTESLNPQLAQS